MRTCLLIAAGLLIGLPIGRYMAAIVNAGRWLSLAEWLSADTGGKA